MNQSSLNVQGFTGRYPFLFLLTAISPGILIQPGLYLLLPSHWLLLTLFSGLLAFFSHRLRAASGPLSYIRMLSLLLSFACLGGLLAALNDIRNNKSWYGHYLEKAEALVVQAEEPSAKERTLSIPAAVKQVKVSGKWRSVHGKLQLYVYRKQDMPRYQAGQRLMIPAQLLRIKNPGNPFAFDYATYAARKGLYYQAFLPSGAIRITGQEDPDLKPLQSLRQALQQSIVRNVTDSTTRALIEASVLNERALLDEELWKAYSVTGIVHIIAISGMHIALLAGLLLFILHKLPLGKWDKSKYLLTIPVIWCYIALTGFPPSAVRAGVMFSLVSAGLLLNRKGNPVNTWAAAGFLLLCYNPYWIYDIGVQLSFLAVLSILLFYSPIRKWYAAPNLVLSRLWQVMAVSIAAQVLVSPLVIYYFHQFPLLGLAANMPATIFSVLLLYGAVGLFLLHLSGVPCLWLGKLLSWLTQGFHAIIGFLAGHTPVSMQQLYIDAYEYWLMMLGIVAFALFFFHRKAYYYYAGTLATLLLLTDLIFKDVAAMRQERMVVYNVSRISLAELFYSKTVVPVYPVPEGKMTQYTSLPARLGFRAVAEKAIDVQRVFRVGKATVLFLEHCTTIKPGHRFPVDFLVVSASCRFDPEGWYATFHPGKIIIDGSLPRWKALQWRQKLEALGAPVHWVQADGAWIFPAL